MMKQIYLLLVFISTASLSSHAQNNFTVSGTVFYTDGQPLAGVSLRLLNKNIGAITDLKGHYSIRVPDGEKDTIAFTYLACKTQKIAIHNRHQINVQLEKAPARPMPVVMTCYCAAMQDKKDSLTTPKNPDHPNKQ